MVPGTINSTVGHNFKGLMISWVRIVRDGKVPGGKILDGTFQ